MVFPIFKSTDILLPTYSSIVFSLFITRSNMSLLAMFSGNFQDIMHFSESSFANDPYVRPVPFSLNYALRNHSPCFKGLVLSLKT